MSKRANPYARKQATAKKRRAMVAAGQYVAPSTYSVRQMAGRPYRAPPSFVARTPGGQITADNHYFDTERTQTNITATAASWAGSEYDPNTSAMLCLFAPTIGDDITNRYGRKIFVKKIRIAGMIKMARGAAAATGEDICRIRIIVYQDKQTNGAQSQGEDVISSGAGSNAMDMFQNIANLGRFKVWKDKKYLMQNPAITADAGTGTIVHDELARPFKFSIAVNTWVNYNSTNGGTVADVVDNSFHLIANAEAASATPNIVYKVRTVFTP